MKTEYDKESDSAYIYLKDSIKPGEVTKTASIKETVNVDFNSEGKIIGIEILNASKNVSLKDLGKRVVV